MKTKHPACPECDKLLAVHEQSQKLGMFLDFLKEKCVLAEWIDCNEEIYGEDARLVPCGKYRGDYGANVLLAEYFDIDLEKVEQERRALLDWIQKENN